MDLKLTPSSIYIYIYIYICLLVEWQEVTKRFSVVSLGIGGTPRETPTTSSLVVVVSTHELRLYNQVPTEIDLDMSNGPTTLTIGETDNAIYFTQE